MSTLLRFPAARMGCSLVRSDLPDRWLESGPMADLLEMHVSTCLACQADFGPGRAVAQGLSALSDVPFHRTRPGFTDAVLDGLGDPTPSELRRRNAVVGWSTGAAVTAVATAAVLVARRSRVVGAH